MGKRKRLEDTGINARTSTKRIKLENDGDVLEMDSSKASRNFIGIDKNRATNYHNSKLKTIMNRYAGMSYQRLKRIMATDTDCDLVVLVEKRHITIGWHQLGEASNAIRCILNSSLGQYRKSLNGILLAVGKIDIIDKPFCIADQPCMHIDLNVNCIVFCPKQGHTYNCLVTAVDKKFVTAKLHNMITFFALIKNTKKSPKIGDQVLIRFSHIEIKGSLCQIKGMMA
uniref:POP4 domain-containing protein n=1 Tax=Elaeophora elaphi TaxID=1147741 RepID=A0A0R3RQP2_9BILA